MNNSKTDELNSTIELLHNAFNRGYAVDILTLLFTTDERDSLVTRVKIIKSLLEGVINQRQLKEELGIGIATVTRGSNSLKEVTPEFKQWLVAQLIKK